MKFERSSGILLHPTSLPGKYGIGTLGSEAYSFIDFLKGSGCKLWQVLPLGPTGYGDSPYQCFSAFAGNPYLISPQILLRQGFLHANDLVEEPHLSETHVDYGKLIPWKLNLLERAYDNFKNSTGGMLSDFVAFCEEKVHWLDEYSLFMAIKESLGGGSWANWPEPIRFKEPKAIQTLRINLSNAVERHKFYQYLFFKQWQALKDYAVKANIKIIGDIPIFVAFDSSDVWSHPELFELDSIGLPTVVAGVPPDYFAPTGQLWGNPIFDWNTHKESGYQWWIDRIKAALDLVDIVRLDHFRGFSAYWEIPFGNPTAEIGNWKPGPGIDFFSNIQKSLGLENGFPFIAEDLGFITPDVFALRDLFGLPGMKILQFAFSGPDNPFLPHHFSQNCVVYSGTHDNDTVRGWFESLSEDGRQFAVDYLQTKGDDISWSLIRLSCASVAVFAINQMQDILSLDSTARMNYPSRLGGNWEWRLPANWQNEGLMDRLKKMNTTYGR
jgi:4-alpha-glucanotransferase